MSTNNSNPRQFPNGSQTVPNRSFKVSRLYFELIRGTKLETAKVSALDLAKQLAAHGFITLLDETRYVELPKKYDPTKRQEFFATVWATKPSIGRARLEVALTLAPILITALLTAGLVKQAKWNPVTKKISISRIGGVK